MKIITSPELKFKLINSISETIDNCQSKEDVDAINGMINLLEDHYPEETEVLNTMRSDLTLIEEELNAVK